MMMLKAFHCNQSGATGIEYAVIALFIVVAIIVGAKLLGGSTATSYNATADTVSKNLP